MNDKQTSIFTEWLALVGVVWLFTIFAFNVPEMLVFLAVLSTVVFTVFAGYAYAQSASNQHYSNHLKGFQETRDEK